LGGYRCVLSHPIVGGVKKKKRERKIREKKKGKPKLERENHLKTLAPSASHGLYHHNSSTLV